MPEYLSPGVYVEEVASGPRAIEGVSTSTAGFAGPTERGPRQPRMVTSWEEYQRWFGGYLPEGRGFLPYAAKGFFDNGGQRLYIARVTGAGDGTAIISLPAGAGDNLIISANGPGAWGSRLMVTVRPSNLRPDVWFRLTILYYAGGIPTPFIDPFNPANLANPLRQDPTVVEDYDNLTSRADLSNYVLEVVNTRSNLVRLSWQNAAAATHARPALAPLPRTAQGTLTTIDANTRLRADARTAGGGPIITVTIAAGAAPNTVDVTVGTPAGAEPVLAGLAAANIVSEINRASSLARVSWVAVNPALPIIPSVPLPAAVPLLGGGGLSFSSVTDVAPTPNEYEGNPGASVDQRVALAGLDAIDEISMLSVPDEVSDDTGQITNLVINQCEKLRDRIAILNVADRSGELPRRPDRDTTYAATYYPFLRVFDPATLGTLLVPPSGHIAGIYARSDVERGVHKAPANEVVRGIVTRDFGPDKPLEFTVTKGQHDILNPRGINVIRDFRSDSRGIRLWGARTQSSDAQWKYVNVRRLFLFVEESIDQGTQWVVFEPNDENTWAAVRTSLRNFLTSVWRSGALFGATTDEAFFVKCDRSTMTPDDIDNGRLIVLIGIAPVKPAEFVIFRISQKTIEA